MRRLLWALGLIAILFCGWWFVAAELVSRSVSYWFDAQRSRGWQAEHAGLETTGFPFRHTTRLDAPMLADPGTGAAWQADALTLDSPAIWPGDQRVLFPDSDQLVAWLDRRTTLRAKDMIARLTLAPGPSLTLRNLGLTAAEWSLSDGQNTQQAAAAGLTLTMTQTDTPELYQITMAAPAFAPGEVLRRLARAAPGLPRSFDSLEINADVGFDRVWDRRALEHRRPQPRSLHLRRADVWWGDLRLSAAGRLEIDETGVPTGSIELRAENWRDMLRMANQSGLLNRSATESAESLLGFLAGLGGQPDILEARINFRGGVMAFGPVPIGPAPRLVLR